MNNTNIPEPDLDNVLRRTLKDDLPSEAEARMRRHFLDLPCIPDQPEILAETGRWIWLRWAFRKETLAFACLVMLILGGVMHLRGDQSVLAHSISRLKMIVAMYESLYRATSMECTLLKPGAGGENLIYRARWRSTGITRVDVDSADGREQTLWISNTTMAPDPKWQPVLEFLTPATLAQHMEKQYGLMQAEWRSGARPDEFVLVCQGNRQIIEIAIDARTYLPTTFRKYPPDSSPAGKDRQCQMEARFLWNQPIPRELMTPGNPVAKRQFNH